jgi:hypothetical protein
MGRKDAAIQKGNVERSSLSRLDAETTGWGCAVPTFAQPSTKPGKLAHFGTLGTLPGLSPNAALFYRE